LKISTGNYGNMMTVDSFKFLPRLIATYYKMTEREPRLPIPWTPLERPIQDAKIGLVTSGGLYMADSQRSFDLQREREQPTWGDPTYRRIPADVDHQDLAVSHLHLNTSDIEIDFNILLPIHRVQEMVNEGIVGGLSEQHFSFMGYQGYPPTSEAWENIYGPEVAEAFINEGVHCVLLTPA
jgi:D-proline reductase (dithiol) PrdB